MVRKHSLYRLAVIAWGLISAAVAILVGSGNARPWISPQDLPFLEPWMYFAAIPVSWLAGAFVIGRFQRRDWKRAGRRANLTPQGGGLTSYPDLVGTVNGRSIRVHTVKRKRNSGGESGSTTVTYTIVETELPAPVENGLVFGDAEGDGLSDLTGGSVDLEAELVGGISVIGASGRFVEEVVTGRVRNAFQQSRLTDSVIVGDATDVILGAMPEMSGPIMGRIQSAMESKMQESFFGDATTVRTQTKGPILDGTELARQAEVVAAVADAYEAATADRATA